MDELVHPSPNEMDWKQEEPTDFCKDETDLSTAADVFAGQSANALPLHHRPPRAHYELAVRLPVQPEVQALCVWLYEPAQQAVRLHVLLADLPARLKARMDIPVEDSIAGWVWQHQQPLIINAEADKRFPEFARGLMEAGIKSFCGLPLMIADRLIGVLGLASTTRADVFRTFKLEYLQRSALQNLDGARSTDPHLPSVTEPESNPEPKYLEEQVRPEDIFEDIISRSTSLRAVLDHIQIVAPTNSTVLILGETGTGKELVARAVHNRSSRSNRPFIRVNCAAIPSGLLESELFGHERGAFTGAVMRKLGRFELANGGTLFLDEIGDIPQELQPKLLRVLQEQEFERLGSTQTTRVDVRVVAATSRNLPQMVANREFRSDLYYRLNVFPVHLPALRERPEDIGLLVRHFVDLCSKRMKKSVDRVPMTAMKVLCSYPWPGNVRELQNFIERSVILSPGKVLQPPLAELEVNKYNVDAGEPNAASKATTLKDAEREHIIQTLAETGWTIGGPKGAAARLGLPRTTLVSMMQRLGIARTQA
ncbi:MAG: Formate hydrogenlyase transcriptional activator [Verrucomicrobiales bacterium]|nr:Formate hydrogenlyase transcriptional activator [Verrucomicrobiales bacterium]